ncbi:hypothetical protein D3C85_1757840 [compost metagenome]
MALGQTIQAFLQLLKPINSQVKLAAFDLCVVVTSSAVKDEGVYPFQTDQCLKYVPVFVMKPEAVAPILRKACGQAAE